MRALASCPRGSRCRTGTGENDTVTTVWTPDELRKLAGAPATEIWIGTVRAALRHAADLADAAHDVRDENERLREWNRQMVEKAASGGTLDGYRELAEKVAAAENERDKARAEVERLKAAIDMQPSPPTREDMEWAGKVHLAEAEKENDALRAEVEALRAENEAVRSANIEGKMWVDNAVEDIKQLTAALEPFISGDAEYQASSVYTIAVYGREIMAARAALAQAKDAK